MTDFVPLSVFPSTLHDALKCQRNYFYPNIKSFLFKQSFAKSLRFISLDPDRGPAESSGSGLNRFRISRYSSACV
jgi:hypothetical protein